MMTIEMVILYFVSIAGMKSHHGHFAVARLHLLGALSVPLLFIIQFPLPLVGSKFALPAILKRLKRRDEERCLVSAGQSRLSFAGLCADFQQFYLATKRRPEWSLDDLASYLAVKCTRQTCLHTSRLRLFILSSVASLSEPRADSVVDRLYPLLEMFLSLMRKSRQQRALIRGGVLVQHG